MGANTVEAELVFDEAGDLVDWRSDDRLEAVGDGRFEPRRWSTPLTAYRTFGPYRLASRGEGRWHPSEGAWTYIELELVEHEIDGRSIR